VSHKTHSVYLPSGGFSVVVLLVLTRGKIEGVSEVRSPSSWLVFGEFICLTGASASTRLDSVFSDIFFFVFF